MLDGPLQSAQVNRALSPYQLAGVQAQQIPRQFLYRIYRVRRAQRYHNTSRYRMADIAFEPSTRVVG